jgi:hypothetical protein
MSELMNTSNRSAIRWQLLSTVSVLGLLASAYTAGEAEAAGDDADRPMVWIELGAQLEHLTGQGNPFTPGFVAANSDSSVLQPASPIEIQNPPPFSFGGESKISFQPENSKWIFAASIRYGRLSNSRDVHHQTTKTHAPKYTNGVPRPTSQGQHFTFEKFADTKVQHRESHAIVDFMAGKDVGLGMFGKGGSSTLSFGARFAQFSSRATLDARARPDLNFKYYPSANAPSRIPLPYFHTYHYTGEASRSFRGIGPSLSWSGSAPFAGNPQNGELTFDWGANAAILFGKQRAHVRHQGTGHYHSALRGADGGAKYSVTYQSPGGHDTDRSVIVPNAGGFAGASWRTESVKVSVGYRADFFFGAMDSGIDKRKSETLGFYGPFASVSVGFP